MHVTRLEMLASIERQRLDAIGLRIGHRRSVILPRSQTMPRLAGPELVENARAVITLENHPVTGGLGSAVAETIAEHGSGRPLARLGPQDTYAVGGTQPYVLERFGLSAAAVVRSAEKLLGARLGLAAGGALRGQPQ